ncbi:DUF3078 domain-containing protein [Myroides sp. WP-1]|uniref:DUF3078 domain-containing protein n=1 Tax=Myroides sp. WP-1 TaxID=2759944 RepID=UPI0015F9B1BF|nr:DUF3078 domain-containing protein [Myroides sp. WP-1]MBB1138292.1 DUF3078 domain-containing protein [Myroides sp. WP-1]
MNKLEKIAFFSVVLSWYGGATFAQEGTTPAVNPQTATSVVKDTVNVQENPFNPLMNFLPRKNYAEEDLLMSYMNMGSREDLAFFKPEVFVERSKPKYSAIKTKFNPQIQLSAIPVNNEIIGYWEKKNRVGLDFNQIAFVNWSAGGDNSIAGLLKGDFSRKYIKGRLIWDNTLNVRYGVNKQSDRELRKTDDVLELNSTFGYKYSLASDWYYVSKLNFRTQFTDGYNYPNTDDPVSRWLAPAYLYVGVGGEYMDSKTGIKYYVSPLTYKATFVNDQTLANQGAFGVDSAIKDEDGNILKNGKRYKAEVGFLVSTEWKKEIFTNIFIDTKLTLYSDYIDQFGNIDVMWDLKLDMKVNDFVRANVGINLIYDDNVKNKVERGGVQVIEGPKIQFKQTLGVGLVYSF